MLPSDTGVTGGNSTFTERPNVTILPNDTGVREDNLLFTENPKVTTLPNDTGATGSNVTFIETREGNPTSKEKLNSRGFQ